MLVGAFHCCAVIGFADNRKMRAQSAIALETILRWFTSISDSKQKVVDYSSWQQEYTQGAKCCPFVSDRQLFCFHQ